MREEFEEAIEQPKEMIAARPSIPAGGELLLGREVEITELKVKLEEMKCMFEDEKKRNFKLSSELDKMEDEKDKMEERLDALKESSARYLVCLLEGAF